MLRHVGYDASRARRWGGLEQQGSGVAMATSRAAATHVAVYDDWEDADAQDEWLDVAAVQGRNGGGPQQSAKGDAGGRAHSHAGHGDAPGGAGLTETFSDDTSDEESQKPSKTKGLYLDRVLDRRERREQAQKRSGFYALCTSPLRSVNGSADMLHWTLLLVVTASDSKPVMPYYMLVLCKGMYV